MAKRKKAKKAKKSGDILVVGSKVKLTIRSKKMLCSAELIPALSDAVRSLLNDAMRRSKENGRSTVRARDL